MSERQIPNPPHPNHDRGLESDVATLLDRVHRFVHRLGVASASASATACASATATAAQTEVPDETGCP